MDQLFVRNQPSPRRGLAPTASITCITASGSTQETPGSLRRSLITSTTMQAEVAEVDVTMVKTGTFRTGHTMLLRHHAADKPSPR